VNATPRPSLFSAANQLRAAGSDAYNASGRNGFGLDDNVYQSLLQNRIIFLGSEVKDENANAICAQMLLLNAEDPHKDIYLYINSPGGSVDSGMAIYDTMKWISNDVATVAIGFAASIEADSDRDRWFTAEQALTYGFIDHVYEAAAQIPSPQAPNQ
jgi:ATP-dependent protease ClpP protease subunit